MVITHIVCMKFADPDDAGEARERLHALNGVVPQIRSLAVGVDLGRSPASYDLALTTTHDSMDALRGYQNHPAHVAVLEWLQGVLVDRVVVDYET